MTGFAAEDNPWVRIEGAKRVKYKQEPVRIRNYYPLRVSWFPSPEREWVRPVANVKNMGWMRAKRAMKSYPDYAAHIAKVAEEHRDRYPVTYIVDGITIHVRDVDPKSSMYEEYNERYMARRRDPLFDPEPVVLSLS